MNASLKEQLQAVALNFSTSVEKKNTDSKQKSGILEYFHYGVELLKAHFSQCFREPEYIQPLKIGIKQDLVKHLGGREDIVINDKACMMKALHYYVNTMGYHKHVVEGATRIDLHGEVVGVVTKEEAEYSALRRQAKKQKLNKDMVIK